MMQVGKILENYSHKQLFSGYGFGGIPDFAYPNKNKEAREAEHCFTLTGKQNKCTV
jgi:hypothetical protein